MDEFRRRYCKDATVKSAVDIMTHMLVTTSLTSHDLARCAVLAAQIYAERYCQPLTLVLRDDGRVDVEVASLVAERNTSP